MFHSSKPYTAKVTYQDVDSNGHYTKWEIQLNRAKNITSTVIAHELGHVIGLTELYYGSNCNKLMFFGDTDRTATNTSTSDVWGAKVITGLHRTHTWSTATEGRHTCTACGGYGSHNLSGVSYSQYNSAYHKVNCKVCNAAVYKPHTFDSLGNRCIDCGYKGVGGEVGFG